MWSILHCDYYVELILQIMSDTILLLDAEVFNLYEFRASISNLENSSAILQKLIVAYRDQKELPESYIHIYSLLIDFKRFLRDCRLDLITYEKENLYKELNLYKDKIHEAYDEMKY